MERLLGSNGLCPILGLLGSGLDKDIISKLEILAIDVPVLQSGNMSLGLNLIAELSKFSTPVLADSYDIEIEERHHNKKADAPSGSAIMLFDKINEVAGKKFYPVYDRSQIREARGKDEIGISSLRGGTIVGEHTVIFAGQDEVIEITHKAGSKAIFANGILKAAEFMINAPAGKLYNMTDVISAEQKQDNILGK